MESKATFKMPPVEHYQDEVEDHEVKRLSLPSCDMLGAEVVGGEYTADCFKDIGEVQAQVYKDGAD